MTVPYLNLANQFLDENRTAGTPETFLPAFRAYAMNWWRGYSNASPLAGDPPTDAQLLNALSVAQTGIDRTSGGIAFGAIALILVGGLWWLSRRE